MKAEDRTTAARVAAALDMPVAVLGIAFLAVFLLEPVVPWLSSGAWEVFAWLATAVFAVELGARFAAAPSAAEFLRQHWWQIALLPLPFLRFLRGVRAARALRGISMAVRSARSSARQLQDRVEWLALITAITALVTGRLLHISGAARYQDSYGLALHDAAMATMSGEPLLDGGIGDWLELLLAAYSLVVIAVLAGAVGDFLVDRRRV